MRLNLLISLFNLPIKGLHRLIFYRSLCEWNLFVIPVGEYLLIIRCSGSYATIQLRGGPVLDSWLLRGFLSFVLLGVLGTGYWGGLPSLFTLRSYVRLWLSLSSI